MAEPIASGTLAKTPLAHLLIYLDQKRLSGTLAIWPDEGEGQVDGKGQDRILLLKGRPMAGRLITPADSLQAGMLSLLQRRSGPYAFYEANLLGDDRLNGRIDPLALITKSLRDFGHQEVVDGVLARVGSARLRMQPQVDLQRFDFDQEEKALIEILLAEPADLATLIQLSGMDEARGRRFIYLLMITKTAAPYTEGESPRSADSSQTMARVGPSAAPPKRISSIPPPRRSVRPGASVAPSRRSLRPGTSVPPAGAKLPSDLPPPATARPVHGTQNLSLSNMPPPPDDLPEASRQRWQEIMMRGRLIENQNYFEMLGVERSAKQEEIRSAFFKLAKAWHPDRLPDELEPIKPYAQVIFGYVNEANTTLSDEEERHKYLKAVREGGGTPATDQLMQQILDSAMEYEKVVVLANRQKWGEAMELLQAILAVIRDDPEYHAMHARIMMNDPDNKARPQDILEACDLALSLYDKHEKAHLYKAQILQKMGRAKEAHRHFKRVVDINPRNMDALREVRVKRMRGQSISGMSKPPGAFDSDGLIGKFFKRK